MGPLQKGGLEVMIGLMNKYNTMDNYKLSIYGGTVFGLVPNLPVENILVTIYMAILGTLTSFLVTVLLKWVGGFGDK